MHRFFINLEDKISHQQFIIRSPEILHQWTKVLKFEIDERIILINGSGYEFVSIISEIGKGKIVGKILEERKGEGESSVKIILAQSFLKNVEKFEWVLQKGTELGVSVFIPLETERTERKIFPKRERWEKILREAAEQSGRSKIPVLLEPCKFEKVFDEFKNVFVPHPAAEITFSKFREKNKILDELVICIGPEGGFSEHEIDFAKEKKAHVVSVGKRILRSETAGIVLATLVNEWAEEL